MKAVLPAIFGLLWTAGCGGGPVNPSPPPTPPPSNGGTLILSGTVYGVDASGRRPLAGATVDISEPDGPWGTFGRPVTNGAGRYAIGSLTARHYRARATMPGYDESSPVVVGFLETSRTLDLELVRTGLIVGPMSVSEVAPAVGSTGGGALVTITGTGFRSAATVAFGAESADAYIYNTTTIYAITPAHAAATVNVTVTNPGGDSANFAGFRFAVPASFNFNGVWKGFALAHPGLPALAGLRLARHSDMDMQFTIENNTLTAFTCGGATIALREPLPSVSNGAFSWADPSGAATLTGRIVADGASVGTINTAACPETRWDATRQ